MGEPLVYNDDNDNAYHHFTRQAVELSIRLCF